MSSVLNYKGYFSKPEMSLEDGILYGKIEGINDLITFEGETIAKLKKAFIEAVDDYLDYCEEIGKEPDKVYKGTFNVRISPDLHKKAANLAIKCSTTLNKIVEKSIESFVQSYDEFNNYRNDMLYNCAQKEVYDQTLEMWGEDVSYVQTLFNYGNNIGLRSL